MDQNDGCPGICRGQLETSVPVLLEAARIKAGAPTETRGLIPRIHDDVRFQLLEDPVLHAQELLPVCVAAGNSPEIVLETNCVPRLQIR